MAPSSLLSFLLLAAADATLYNRLVILGDSFSDREAIYRYTYGYIPLSYKGYNGTSEIYDKDVPFKADGFGRRSNGPIWPEYFRGMAMTKPKAPIDDYAFAGARAYDGSNPQLPLQPSPVVFFLNTLKQQGLLPNRPDPTTVVELSAQLASYLAAGVVKDKKALHVLQFGANDPYMAWQLRLQAAFPGTTYKNVTEKVLPSFAAGSMMYAANTLLQNGAKNVAVFGLPSMLPPYIKQISVCSQYTETGTVLVDVFDVYIQSFNAQLKAAVEQAAMALATTCPKCQLTFVDFSGLEAYALEDPRITDTTTKCFEDGTDFCRPDYPGYPYSRCADATGLFWYDGLHLTTVAHEVVAKFILESLAGGDV